MSEGNPIISTAKQMSEHMRHLAEYSKGRGIIEVRTHWNKLLIIDCHRLRSR